MKLVPCRLMSSHRSTNRAVGFIIISLILLISLDSIKKVFFTGVYEIHREAEFKDTAQ